MEKATHIYTNLFTNGLQFNEEWFEGPKNLLWLKIKVLHFHLSFFIAKEPKEGLPSPLITKLLSVGGRKMADSGLTVKCPRFISREVCIL